MLLGTLSAAGYDDRTAVVVGADGIVVDIGGTTTDVGAVQQAFPRPASTEAVLAGARMNQRVPDIFCIG